MINGPPTGHQDIESMTIAPTSDLTSESSSRNHERSVERVVATEPQMINTQAAPVRCASRRATAGLASNEPPPRYRQAAGPVHRIDDTPKRRKRDDS